MLCLLADLKHALRSLCKTPALAGIGIVSLALGIGPNITIYSIVREMILDDISARQPDRLARVSASIPYDRYRELRDAGVFEDLAFSLWFRDANWMAGTHREVVWQIATSANFFEVLGVEAGVGRLYSQRDEGHPVAVVSHGFWSRRLHRDSQVVGRTLHVDGKLYLVTGVLPRDYRSIVGHGVSPEVYLMAPPNSAQCRPFGRLRDGMTRSQAREALAAAARNIGGEEFARRVSGVRPMAGLAANAGEGTNRRFLLFFVMLYGTAALLTLIACLNAGGLLLLRGAARQRELAIRKALGASRGRLIRQLLAEGAVLVGVGAGAGLILDSLLREKLSYIRWPTAYNLPMEFHFQTDRGLYLYAVAAALLTLLISSLLPAVRSSDVTLNLAMKQGEPAFSLRRWSLRNGFLAVQLAVSVVLVSLGLLFTRSFVHLAKVDPGFDVKGTVIVVIRQPQGQHEGESGWEWRDRIVERIREVPGVTGVTSIGTLPLMGELQSAGPLRRRSDSLVTAHDAYELGGGEAFCRVLRIPLLLGRDFELADRSRRPVPVILSRTLAQRLFGDEDPVGREIAVNRPSPEYVQVVGVAADAKLRSLGEEHPPVFFTPFSLAQLVVSTKGEGAGWVRPLQGALSAFGSGASVEVRPMADAAAGALFPMRVAAGFAGSLALVGLVLVLVGLYGSVAHATRRRAREMAIRSAIGASHAMIVRTAIGDGMTVLVCGIVTGLPLAAAAIVPFTDILPDGLHPYSPAMFAAVALVPLAVGTIAAWMPARGVANVDPSSVLREE
ncbi:MAG: ABC transporter permease [Bryobacterales bacterium]|nr:ABC transporter permease [Bryobacterales bacterium]